MDTLDTPVIDSKEQVQPQEDAGSVDESRSEDKGGYSSFEDLLSISNEGNEKDEQQSIAQEQSVDTSSEGLSPEEQTRVDDLIAKNDTEGLSEEEIKELEGFDMVDKDGSGDDLNEDEGSQDDWKAPDYVDIDRLKALFPENTLVNKESTKEALSSAFDHLEKYQETDRVLTQALEKNPEAGTFLKALMNGDSMIKAFIEAGLDPKDAIPEPGEDGYDEYVIEKNKRQNISAQREANLNQSFKDIPSFYSENKIGQGLQVKMGEELNRHFQDIANGKITKDLMQLVHKGLTADERVDTAQNKSFIDGQNQKIKIKTKAIKKDHDEVRRPSIQSGSVIRSQDKLEYANDGSKELYEMLGVK